MAAKTKKKFVRKTKKQYRFVNFTLPEIYGDTEISVPASDGIPLKVARGVKYNDVTVILDYFEDAGVDQETVSAISDLDRDEFTEFMKVWGETSGVQVPKSSD